MSVFQVRLTPDGLWHRHRSDDATRTACGELLAGAFSHRDHTLLDDLCPVCFTRHEIETGKMQKIEKEARAEDPDLYFDEDDDPTDPDGDPD